MTYILFDDNPAAMARVPTHAVERIRAIARFYDITPASAQVLDSLCSRPDATDPEAQSALTVIRLLLESRRDRDWSQRCLQAACRQIELHRVRLARDLIVHANTAHPIAPTG